MPEALHLPFGLSAAQASFMMLALFAAAFVRGYSGFGFAALVVASAALVTNPLHFVPVVLLVDLPLTLAQLGSIRGNIDWRRVFGLSAGALFGAPVGVALVSQLGADPARVAIALFVLAMCVALLAGWTITRPMRGGHHVGVGLVSGLANGASIGGLPVAAFFAAQPIAPAVFRATVIVYFTIMDLVTLPLMWRAGMVSLDTLTFGLLAMPVLLLGVWLGGRHFLNATPQGFRRFAIYLLASLAALGLAKGVL